MSPEIEPIKDLKKIRQIRKILRRNNNGRRDEFLFVLGINTGYKINDLLSMKVGDVWSEGPRKELRLKEKKTGALRTTPINPLVAKLLTEYIASRPDKDLDSFLDAPLFLSRKKKGSIDRRWVAKVLKKAGEDVGLPNIATYSLRKTFGYHIYKKNGNNIAMVQKLLNQSRGDATLKYIGITREELDNLFLNLNLG
jgi:integrase